jgi:uncharacterized protein (TIGR03435 family)
MIIPGLDFAPWPAALVNHLWQSTVFALGAWLLALALRRNLARIRYCVWMAASLKFIVPFSLLIAVGGHLPWWTESHIERPEFLSFMDGLAEPLLLSTPYAGAHIVPDRAQTAAPAAMAGHAAPWLPLLLVTIWGGVALSQALRWAAQWWRLRRTLQAAEPLKLKVPIPVLLTTENVEPGIFGILRPVLLLPRGVMERLSASQLDAIVAHELCHMRRRDNLTAALHMVVEALFWFHPAVWWIRARLMEERERACDEAVLDSNREALVYAEGILNVSKFYVEAPLICVSGVTGSDLKSRITRIMAEQVGRKLDLTRKLMLAMAVLAAVGTPVIFGFAHAAQAQAQSAAPAQAPAAKTGIEGTWQGTLHLPDGGTLRIVNKIAKDSGGAVKVQDYSIDQGGQPMQATSASFDGGVLKYGIQFIDGAYEGKMSADGNSITGTWTQNGHSLALVFERATPSTEWAIPEPPPKVPPMAADVDPGIEVATVKPSKPDEQRRLITFRGRELVIVAFTLNDIIKFGYGVQEKQILNGPDWMGTERFDVNAQPDQPGVPNRDQLKSMLQKLLADRFQLKFHNDKKEMSAFVLTVGKDGPKMTKSSDDPKGLPGLFFGPIGTLHVRNATMADFTELMQSAVLDRPVVDQTALSGKWDFILKWTPDESQFAGLGVKVPPPTDSADAPPPLFTAIQEQLDLKLEAEKTQVPVLVLDHVDHPSPN